MEVELHDGTVLEFPDGTDMAVVKAAAKRYMAQQAPQAPQKLSAVDDFIGGAKATLKGAVKGATAIPGMIADVPFQVANLFGADVELPSQAQSALLERYVGATPSHGSVENLAAAGTSAMLPVGMAQRFAGPLAKALAAGPGAQLIGAVSGEGARQYAESEGAGPWGQTAAAVLGGVGGALVPQAIGAAGLGLSRLGYHAVEPWLAGGDDAIMGRQLTAAADGKERALVEALRSYEPPVEGSIPTAGQAGASVGSTGFSALQDVAENSRPGIKDAYVQRARDQGAARMAQVRSVGGDDEAMAVAEALRKRNAAKNYGPLLGETVQPQADDALISAEIARTEAAKAAALQDSGRYGTMAAQQRTLAQGGEIPPNIANTGSVSGTAYPREGLPMPDEAMSSYGGAAYRNQARVPEAQRASADALKIYGQRRLEESWLNAMREKLSEQSDGLSRMGLDDFLTAPSVKRAVDAARDAAAERRIPFPATPDEPFSIQNLQDIKYALDKNLLAARNAVKAGSTDLSNEEALGGTRDLFVKWLESKSPEWGKARKAYAADSDPLNRMGIGQFVEGKLANTFGEDAKQRAQSYAAALKGATDVAKKSNTGTNRFKTIDEAFQHKPEELVKLRGVLKDLENDAQFDFLVAEGRKVSGGALKPFTDSLDEAGHGKRPQLWDRVYSIANHIIDRAKGRIDQRLAEKLALTLLDKDATADLMEKAIEQNSRTAARASALRVFKPGAAARGALAGATATVEEE